MKSLGYFRRLLATIIDKIVILACIFPLVYIIPDKLGYYVGLLTTHPQLYGYMNMTQTEIVSLDLSITSLLLLISILTSFIPEAFLRASLGKFFLGGIITGGVNVASKLQKTTFINTLLRFVVYAGIMIAFVTLRFALNLNYVWIIILYYIVIDIPVLFCRRSLIDIITCTYVIKRERKQKQLSENSISPITLNNKEDNPQNININYNQNSKKHLLSKQTLSIFLYLLVITLIIISLVTLIGTVKSKELIKEDTQTLNKLKTQFPFYYEEDGIAFGVIPTEESNLSKIISSLNLEGWNINKNSLKMWVLSGEGTYQELHYKTVKKQKPIYKWQKITPTSFDSFLFEYHVKNGDFYIENGDYYEKVFTGNYYTYDEKEPYYISKPNPWYYSIITFKTNSINHIITYEEELTKKGIQHKTGYLWGSLWIISDYKDEEGNDEVFFFQNKEYVYYIYRHVQYDTNGIIDYIVNDNQSIKVHLLNVYLIRNMKKAIFWYYFKIYALFAVLLILFIAGFIGIFRNKKNNRTSYKLYIWGVFCLLINIIIFLVQFNIYWTHPHPLRTNLYDISLFFSSFVVMDVIFLPIIWRYANSEFKWDFLIPSWCNKYLDKRLKNEQERKSFVALVMYPLYIVGVAPFGVFIWLYIIPMSLILFIVLELRALTNWITPKKTEEKKIKNKSLPFKDYYLLLGLSQTATIDDINVAFNKQLALFQSNPGLYNKQYRQELVESYQVLSSEQRIRPLYDSEYQKYLQQHCPDYVISDENLLRDISVIREQMTDTSKPSGPKLPEMNVNAVLLSFFISIIVLTCLLPAILPLILPKFS